jgi:tetratricopeptide (TPR) repeat protein
MRRVAICLLLAIIAVAALRWSLPQASRSEPQRESDESVIARIVLAHREDASRTRLIIDYPLDETLFPPEGVAPTFRWRDDHSGANAWLLTFAFEAGEAAHQHLSRQPAWTPTERQWRDIKQRSLEATATVTILGVDQDSPESVLSRGETTFRTSRDEVGAPIFYREVNLPFVEAVKDPSRIRWRFGTICSTQQPQIVLQNLPVCGNCHSFSSDASTLGMDVDYANSKGSYVIAGVEKEIVLDKKKIITWDDYQREDGKQTFGLLSQVSPDGRYIVSTVKDQSVFVPTPDRAFSQLFFPIQGILAFYDRETGTFRALPGADDPQYVQSNPSWSPDGKYIVFARARAYHLKNARSGKSPLLTKEECVEFLEEGKTFPFDLYRLPFNDGQGGRPEPLRGASHNGRSNYFARYSPNGQWIVFCQAKSFMLLQPDSALYIIPAEGGAARRLRCNTDRMNSWHSWSPNSKWLVFSSKANSDYTQLFLTHIDDQGNSSPPVVLSHFTSEGRAANIPEFVNANPDSIDSIREQFLDDHSYLRAGSESLRFGDHETAERSLRKALEENPDNAIAHNNLGYILLQRGQLEQAKQHFLRSIAADPDQRDAENNLSGLLIRQRDFEQAAVHARNALRLDPDFPLARLNLGTALSYAGKYREAIEHLTMAAQQTPDNPSVHYELGVAWHQQGKTAQAAEHYEHAVQCQEDFVPALATLATIRAVSEDAALRNQETAIRLAVRACEATRYEDAQVLDMLAGVYAATGRFDEAVAAGQRALVLAQSSGSSDHVAVIQEHLRQLEHARATDFPRSR